MTIHYKLSKADFLAYQLYASSKSAMHKKSRFRSRLFTPVIYLLFGAYFISRGEHYAVGVAFVVLGVLWFIFYPLYSQGRYKRHFEKHIDEHYQNRVNKPLAIALDENALQATDADSLSKIDAGQLKELIETPEHFFIKLASGDAVIVPKAAIFNQAAFKARLTEMGATYVNELNWKWR